MVFSHCLDALFHNFKSAFALNISVVNIARTIVAKRDFLEASVYQFVNLLTYQYPIGRDELVHSVIRNTPNVSFDIFVQKWFAPVEADRSKAKLFSVIY
ncbi:hypothetical protein AVO45_17200 [Ruegeria marisrubri]|uniref:Uncharacterized protein n=1 Tax=Ruegeria marisrubri TaxID=1685379 RepID=A0A0X3UDF5_9RHOB|nr:hypothetical protein AVO45_17200 [Ruegeria marisrubri]